MHATALRAIALAGLLVSFSGSASAQTAFGAIELTVADTSGAVIPGATVTAEHLATGAKHTAITDHTGVARFAMLPPGGYRLRADSEGFRAFEATFEIQAGAILKQHAVLQIGEVAEAIEVSASAPTLQAQSAGMIGTSRGRRKSRTREPNRESYAYIEESGFQRVKTRPLSTFSTDVDTASYTNVRRFLNDGQMPPKDAVRIEELLNYFRYDDAAPDGEHPVAISTEVARCPWAPDHKLARIALRTKPIAAEDLPPVGLTFLLDVSGSMESPDKLPLLREAFSLLADQLRAEDSVAIVIYAGAAGVVLQPTPGSQKATILQAIGRLRAGGSTAGAAGIRKAYELARSSFRKGGVNRVILATDGDFNVGVSSDSELIRLIEAERESGVFLTVMGFGTGNLQDSKMEQIADHGNGQYLYIDSAMEARRALVEQIGGTLVTVAKDVKIQVEFNPRRVKRYRLIGYENRLLADEDFKNDKKDAGDLGAGHSVVALYEIVPQRGGDDGDSLRYQDPEPTRRARRSGELLHVKVRYKPPTSGRSRELAVAVQDDGARIERASANLRWASAVAEFGMLLRDSGHMGDASWESASELAAGALAEDPRGERSELVRLLETAAELDGESTTSELRR